MISGYEVDKSSLESLMVSVSCRAHKSVSVKSLFLMSFRRIVE